MARNLVEELTRRSRTQYEPPFSIALIYVGLGDHKRAIEWLAKSLEERSSDMTFAKTDPLLDPSARIPNSPLCFVK